MLLTSASAQISPQFWPDGIHVSSDRDADEGYLAVATNWDGQWYRDIALYGYPDALPRDGDGSVLRNQWAFYPLYPALVRALMSLSGNGFAVSAVTVSTLAGLSSMILIYRLFEMLANLRTARIATIGMCFIPLAPIYQMAYTESLALLLLTGLLLSVRTSKYLISAFLILLLALTRPVGLPIAAALASWAVVKYFRDKRDPEIRSIVALSVIGFLSFGIWPAFAGLATGDVTAYVATQRAWNPSAGTFAIVEFIQLWTPWALGALLAMAILGIFLRLASWGVNDPLVKSWSIWYVVYILSVVSWNVTAARYFILAYPIAWPLARLGTRAETRVSNAAICFMIACFLGIQWQWVRTVVVIDGFSPYAP